MSLKKFSCLPICRLFKIPDILQEFGSQTFLNHDAHVTITQQKYKRLQRSLRSKGQNPLISHALSIVLLMVLVGAIVSSLNTVRSDFRSFIGTHEIENTCELIKSGIEKLYTGERYNSSVNITSRVFVSLPERIGDMNYRARFVNDSAIIEAFGPPSINDTCRIGFNITYRGSTSGGRTEINYTRFSEGIDLIFMGRA